MPTEFTSTMKTFNMSMAMYQYRAGDGTVKIRPPGLGDNPGAASGAGLFVAIVGLAYMGLPVSLLRKLLGLLMGIAGIVVIFLSHVRSSLVVVLGCAVVYAIIMVGQGRWKTVLTLAFMMVICGVCALSYAELYGGKSTLDRFATLLAENPLTVYEKSFRMGMVTSAFDTLLVEHPFGAGLGRWGMMRAYFGTDNNPDSPPIWSEVQFSSWVLDGGIVLLSLYLIALVVVVQRLIRLSFSHHSLPLRQWGAVIIMLSAGPIAFMFSYTPFNSQMGMQFWLLIGAFEGLAQEDEEHTLSGHHHDYGILLSQDRAVLPGSQNNDV